MNGLTLIVAMDAQRGIGIEQRLPWHLPEDLARFKRLTSGHPIIMGRKTFESIGRVLPNRRHLVITRNPLWSHPGVETAHSLEQAVAMTAGVPAFIIGGGEIFREAMALADRMEVTEIAHSFACDAFFPPIAPTDWVETARERYHSDSIGVDYAFVTLERAAPQPPLPSE